MKLKTLAALALLSVLALSHASAQNAVGMEVTVKVGGQVKNNGTYILRGEATITDAIKAAGGVNEFGAKALRHVHVMRGEKVIVVDVKSIMSDGAENFRLQDNDVIQVPELIF